ncbi:hypothetical protein [Listeria booriae]|uniref:Uncharacterized protein n=1 Tax=Listeria booriae TaxID=1552123 RepID=A0A7X1CB21_9LIST|nr:hypothetical protein [Listeria booriae]MBC1490969.1 hypothetical protein [Listeria booriae]MBC1491116.1 hypothetical protein [Listeria booriae]MBC2676240.1 hypothetical protein [Listeria booriae]MBC6151052.1 hypothetical protein [Listeria booriae]MBC6151199.1 hypothetical protein [Listeria booriae]
MTEEFYKIEKGDKFYEDAQRIYHQDRDAFSEEVSKLLEFEAKGNIAFNRKQLLIKKSALEEFKPEWIPLFKKGEGDFVTPRASQKELIEDYTALRKKYDMDIDFGLLMIFSAFRGAAEIIYDIDNSGFVYMQMDNKQGEETQKRYTKITEIEFVERKLESLKFEEGKKS